MNGEREGVTVVIVDDHDDVRSLLKMNLQMDPRFTCVGEADNGGAALDVIAEKRPDAVILDLNMPGLSGLGTIRALLRVTPETKIAVYSAMYDKYDADDLLENRAHLYVDKARPVPQLLDELYEICR